MKDFDLDPADLAARVDLRNGLYQRRQYLGLSGEETARRCGFASLGAVRTAERRTSWDACWVQQWARGLDRMVRLSIVGLTLPDDDATALVLKATTAFGYRDEDLLHLQIVTHDLIRTRKAMGFTTAELAQRCGVTDRAIRDWEERPETSFLRMYQRYARGLGGAVALELQPVVVAVAS